MPTHGPANPACPRCGYDQSGVVAAWTDRCPLETRCTECGRFFRWAAVLEPGRTTHRWSIEHAYGPRGLLRAAAQTTARAPFPDRYWRSMGLVTPVRPIRIAVLIIAWWLVIRALAAVPTAAFIQLESGRVPAYAPFWDRLTTGLTPEFAWSYYRLALGGGLPVVGQLGACQTPDSPEVFFLSLWPLSLSAAWLAFAVIWHARAVVGGGLRPHLFRAWLMSALAFPLVHELVNVAAGWGYLTRGALHGGVILTVLFAAPVAMSLWWRAAVKEFVPEATLRFFVYANLAVLLIAPAFHVVAIMLLELAW